jgi:methyl-accepting chemotaxis protein
MNIRQRVERIQNEIEGVASQYGVTSWEREFLDSVVERAALTERQEKTLTEIEQKVFG